MRRGSIRSLAALMLAPGPGPAAWGGGGPEAAGAPGIRRPGGVYPVPFGGPKFAAGEDVSGDVGFGDLLVVLAAWGPYL